MIPSFFRQTAEPMLLVDERQVVRGLSRGAETLLGIAAAEAEGRGAATAFRSLPTLADCFSGATSDGFTRTEYIAELDRWISVRAIAWGRDLLVLLTEDPTAALLEASRGLAAAAGDFAYSYRCSAEGLRSEWFSEGFGRATGYRAREIRDLESWIERIAEEDRAAYRAALATASGQVREIEYRIFLPDGTSRCLLDRARPVLDEAGALVALNGVVVDNTARKEAEARLASTRDLLRSLLESLPLALVGLDRDDLVTHWNPAAERLFGWPAEEVLSRPYPLATEETGEEHRRVLQDAFQGGKGFAGIETKRQRKDGSLVDVAIWTAPIPAIAGRPPFTIGIFLDLTERKRLEDQLYQSQKMEAVGRLAGGIAHDFNNLMTIVTGQAAMLLEDGQLDHSAGEAVAEIGEAGEKASLLTRQLLAFSRRQVLQPRVVSINESVADMERLLRRVIREDIELTIRLDPELGYTRVDPTQFQQVVMNLVVNASDAMPDGGPLEVRTLNRRIGPDEAACFPYPVRTGEYVALEVEDSGAGMPDSVRQRIFEPFFTTKTHGKGTGLGLSTVYGIVKQSGGYIWVESGVGGGSTFRVHFPSVAERPQDEPAGGPAVEYAAPAGGTVLVVEDESAVRHLVRRVLESEGFTVLVAASGDEAIAVAGEHRGQIDLLLSDVVMPGLRGPEVLQQVSQERPGMAAIFMSGYSEEVLDMDEFVSTAVSFLSKPFTPDRLRRAVARALGAPEAEAPVESAAPREHGVETMLKRLEGDAALANGAEAARKLLRAGELCVRAAQRERALRYLGRAVDAFLEAGMDAEAERVCVRILDVAPSVVRARRTLALLAIGRADTKAAVDRVADYVRAAIEARQSDLAVKQLRLMAGLSREEEFRGFLAKQLDILGGPSLGSSDGRGIDHGRMADEWTRAVQAALAPPSSHLH